MSSSNTCKISDATDPSAILQAEHRLIEQAVRCLSAVANLARGSHRIVREDGAGIIGFLAVFADANHERKEEEIVFPALERVAQGSCSGLRHEHEELRQEIEGLRTALDRDRADLFGVHAARYAAALARHIQAEEAQVLPMIASRLDAAARTELVRRLHGHQMRTTAGDACRRMIALAADLGARYGTALAIDDPDALELLNERCYG